MLSAVITFGDIQVESDAHMFLGSSYLVVTGHEITCFGNGNLPERLNVRSIRILTHSIAFLHTLSLLNIKIPLFLIYGSMESFLYRWRTESQPCRSRKILTLSDPVSFIYKYTLITSKYVLNLRQSQRLGSEVRAISPF